MDQVLAKIAGTLVEAGQAAGAALAPMAASLLGEMASPRDLKTPYLFEAVLVVIDHSQEIRWSPGLMTLSEVFSVFVGFLP